MKCLCATTRRAARLLTLRYEEALRPAGMTVSQFEVMGVVSARPRLSQAELAAVLVLDPTTLSRNLRVLTRRAWIEQVRSTEDGRRSSYALTNAGEAAWRAALPLWRQAQERVQRALGTDLDPDAMWGTLEHLSAAALPG